MGAAARSPAWAGLRGRCPRCGEGRLFQGLLTFAPRCAACDLDIRTADTGDGPAVFVIFGLGAIATPLAIWLEAAFEPPLWLFTLVLSIVVLGGAVAMLRPLKGLLFALQYRNKSGETSRNDAR